METEIGMLDQHLLLGGSAIAISLLLVILVIKILKTGSGLILSILAIVLMLHYGLGISPKQLWIEVSDLPQTLFQMLYGLDLRALMSGFAD